MTRVTPDQFPRRREHDHSQADRREVLLVPWQQVGGRPGLGVLGNGWRRAAHRRGFRPKRNSGYGDATEAGA
jgi:hypothetical protein